MKHMTHLLINGTGLNPRTAELGHKGNVELNGRAVGLTDKPVALLRWMVAGPEIARLVNEFD